MTLIRMSGPRTILPAGLVDALVSFFVLIAVGSWAFSQAKAAWRGEEVKKPF